MLFFTISVDTIDTVYARELKDNQRFDEKVRAFLDNHKYRWQDMNVPGSDGKVLYDLIIKNNYKNALEIGTSTGHSAIWMAWALSKTGGKLITLEINEYRYQKALENFKKAGLSNYIDARLGDAHEMVPKLKGPFDFIFVDADKDWYTRYLKLLLPKLKKGGCFTAHNVLNVFIRGIKEFRDYLERVPNLETTILRSSRSGVSVSYKKSE
jgi:predicted O-methyltransferase YrrM